MDLLTLRILEYKRTGQGKKEIIEDLGISIYQRLPGGIKLSEDERSDFFTQFFPRIPFLLDRFVYQGKSFEAYFNTTVRYAVKTFKLKQILKEKENTAYENSLFWYQLEEKEPSFLSYPPGPVPTEIKKLFKIGKDGIIHDPAYQRRLLFLILKSAYFIEPSLIQSLAPLGGFDCPWLEELVETLKSRRRIQNARYLELINRKNQLLIKAIMAQERLTLTADPKEREHLTAFLDLSKCKIMHYTKEIRNIPQVPTNKEIAGLLSIPKGTVDSALFLIKKGESRLYNKDKIYYSHKKPAPGKSSSGLSRSA